MRISFACFYVGMPSNSYLLCKSTPCSKNFTGERSRKCAKLQTSRGSVRANARSFKLCGGTFAQMREAPNFAGERSRNARSFKMSKLAKSRKMGDHARINCFLRILLVKQSVWAINMYKCGLLCLFEK